MGALERERELARIAQTLDDALRAAGGLLVIEGQAGIGKTTLAQAATAEARRRGMRVLRAAGRELERDFPHGVVGQLFDPVLRSAAPTDRKRLLDGAGGAAAALGLGASEAESSEFATLHGLYWLVANLAEEGPLLAVVDDAHWADTASSRFLAFLLPRLGELPVAVLLCARPEEWAHQGLFAGSASDAATQPLLPAPLSAGACAALVRARLDGPVDDAFAAACHGATQGNPFLVRALLDELVEEGVAPRAANAEVVAAIGPRSVTRTIAARLGRLSEAARPLAAAVAVLGDGTSAHEAAALAGLAADEARGAADELARAAILAPAESLCFTHPIVRNALYADLGSVERQRLHREAARMLERQGATPDRVAAQLLALDPADDRHVGEVLRRAAREALAAGASDSAVRYLRRALAEPCAAQDRGELLVELGGAERLVDGSAAIEHLGEALEVTADRDRYAEVATQLAWALTLAARYEEAVVTAERALSRLGGERRELGRRLEAVTFVASRLNPALADAAARVRSGLDGVELEAGVGAQQLQAFLIQEQAPQSSAAELVGRVERLLAGGMLFEQEAIVASVTALRILIEADSERALPWLDRAVEHARQTGDDMIGGNLCFRCLARLRRGELAEALLDGAESLAAAERWGAEFGRPFAACFLADALVETGDLEGADRALASAVAADGARLSSAAGEPFARARANLFLARGDARGALELALALGALREGPVWRFLWWRSVAALSLAALGEEPERARALAEDGVELTRRWGAPGALGAALRARGVALGDEASLREAVAVLEGSICRLEHAKALVELGAMLRRTGRRRESRAPLSEGLRLARICGAQPLVARTETELRATGASPRDVIVAGLDALTASERRVCEMAAQGMTNKQIAQALYVTVKTVETHLRRAYMKLDVSSRSELPQALDSAS